MKNKTSNSPRDTHGPIVKTGPTAGQNRSRNSDGQWRAKRSDAGISRSCDGEINDAEIEAPLTLIFFILGVIGISFSVYYFGFTNIVHVLLISSAIISALFIIKNIFLRNTCINIFSGYNFYNFFILSYCGIGSLFFSVPIGIYILVTYISIREFNIISLGMSYDAPEWFSKITVIGTVALMLVITPHYLGYFAGIIPISIYYLINDYIYFKKTNEDSVRN